MAKKEDPKPKGEKVHTDPSKESHQEAKAPGLLERLDRWWLGKSK